MDRISAMRVFSEVVTRGSFTAAANTLGMSRAMVTRHIGELERWLGARLLQRSTRRLSLTEAGEACVVRSRQLLELVNDVEQVVGQRDTEPHGQIRVQCNPAFGQAYLSAILVDYLARYPRTNVDLVLSDASPNLVDERIDLAIRMTNELDPALLGKKLATCRNVLCCTPGYLEKQGALKIPEDLAQHNCLAHSRVEKSQWSFSRDGEERLVQVSGSFSANDIMSLVEAVRAGGGVALLPNYVVAPMLHSGDLVAVLPDWQPDSVGVYAVYISRRHQPASLRTMLEFLSARFASLPSWD
ncbi:LysR family transcriptional regulator [Pseudorhodoferax sp. Leaf267]|uniref:LysR family transcriptional regulator n=1 Tax=Pseudorhodoferax sp. Leaf267 TaxID=1736316 RepID=UPI0006F62A5B|nr:LysR family transcriptional regulator [Pseudorhodoferax sp. Leaf267]KQP22170.1 LysR family transcriptional regulator [Pseudorhodoferax sp. Leaf267]